MKSLFIFIDFPPISGGICSYNTNIIKHLPPEALVIMAPTHDGFQEATKGLPGKLYFRPYYREFPPLHKLRDLWRVIRYTWPIIQKEQVGIIHCSAPLLTGPVGLFYRLVKGIPYIVYTYASDVTRPQSSRLKRYLLQLVLKKAAKIVTISEFTKNEIVKLGLRPEQIVKMIGIDQAEFSGTAGAAEKTRAKYKLAGKKILLTVSRLVDAKGMDMVIRLLPEIKKMHTNIVYVVIGTGPDLERLKKLSLEMGVADSVIFTGFVTLDDLRQLYSLCDVFIMLTRQTNKQEIEGFGLVFLEANMYKKPVVAGYVGGVPDAVADGVSGLLVDPLDLAAATLAIEKLLDNEDLARRLGEQGYQRAVKEFAWPQQIKKLTKVIAEIEQGIT
ncbi:MAG: glycosyltransferase family 4 protein [bacterium]|nr:glycosyltransferase family 4 protein [bacterium]MDD5755713.1 glycosyltransferase family 4 protein [bacterium]